MTAGIIIFLITYIFIASEKVDKAVAAVLGAGAMVIFQVAKFPEMLTKVDLNVLALLIGMMIIVNIMATTGILEYLTVKIARLTGGNGHLITLGFLLATAFISAFMDNVTTVILMAPVTILLTQMLNLPTVPILILEAIFSNIGGTATLIGDPPNILIGASCNLSFNQFLVNLMPCIVIMTLLIVGIIILIMRKPLRTGPEAVKAVAMTDASKAILDMRCLRRSLWVFGLVLAGFFTGTLTGLEPGLVAICGAFLMTLVCKVSVSQMLEKVEWSTIIFFCGLFLMIGALELNGVFTELGKAMVSLTQGNFICTMLIILWGSAILSALIDNIPLVIAMIPLIQSIIPTLAKAVCDVDVPPDYYAISNYVLPQIVDEQIRQPLFWALALGACLGGNGTLVGASANVVISQIARKNHYRLTFMDFTRYGAPIMLLSTVISTIYLYLRYMR
ncbi:MAG: ArsB/NhaD family transporter [Victivallaceae bacterium]